MIVEAGLAQLVDLDLVNLLRMGCDKPCILAQGIVLIGNHPLAGTIVVTEPVYQGGILPHAAEIVPMRGEAIGTAVDGRHHNADHFLLGVGEIAGVVIEIGFEIQKADVLFGIQGQHLEEVVDKAPVLFHGLNIFVENGIFLIRHFITVGFLQAGELFIKYECHK